jgi:aminoglycoside 2'-N-acetyltransferase I
MSSPAVRRASSDQLTSREVAQVRAMLDTAFRDDGGRFADSDWEHALGGVHVVAEENGEVVSHGSVVERRLEAGGRMVRAGYVEAVGTWPKYQRRGLATIVMREIGDIIRERYELGALSTPVSDFYAQLGWALWRGPTAVRSSQGVERTPDDDGGIMILTTPSTPPLNLDDEIVCEWRDGDVW